MGEKKYYWIKLKTNFFNSEQIDFLMSQNEGSKYVVLYQMLCLNTANNDGELSSKIGEMIVPYNVEKIVRDTKYFNENDVIVSLELFKKLGLIYEEENQILKIANFDEMVGGETKWAEKKRIYREKQKQLQIGHSEDNVRQENRDKSIENRVIDIDKDKDKKNGRPMDAKEYFANAELNSIFLEFIEVRKKLKAVNSERAIKTLINKLNKYDDNTKYKMIENSIVNSWKDVYELKEQKTTGYNKKPVREEIVPDWFNKEQKKETMSAEDQAEVDELFKRFDEPYKPNPELQQRLKEKYGKKQNV
jgi:predicted phage replisome organizer